MKRALLLFVVASCGGGNANTTATTTTPTSSATSVEATAAPSETASSPEPIGNRHKKIGNGWFLSGSGKEFYEAIYEPGANPLIVVKQTPTNPAGRWVTLMKNTAATPYLGKKIRIRVSIKTSGMPSASGAMARAELWARTAMPHQAEDAPSIKTPLDVNAEMKEYSVTLDVKDTSRVIEYGASIAGDGELRVGRDAIDLL